MPPIWPHFFSDASWSSRCTPAAPASIIALVSSKTFSGRRSRPRCRRRSATSQSIVVVALGVVDLVGALQRAVDRAHDLGHGVDRVEPLVGVHLAREVGVGGDLPAAQVDRLEAGADLLDRLVAGAARRARRRTARSCSSRQSFSAPSRASVCSTCTDPRSFSTSSAEYGRSIPCQRSSSFHARCRPACPINTASVTDAGPDHQRHGGRRRDLALGSGERRRARLRGGPPPLHGGDQRDGPRRVRRRRDRGRGDGLPRRGRRALVQLADPRRAGRALRVRRADALDRVHGDARGAAATPRCSSASTPARAPSAACSRTRSARRAGTSCASTARVVGEVGINAALCGTWGCPVALVTGDDVVCAEATRAARPRAADARGQDGARPLQRPPPLPRSRPRAPRGRRPRGAGGPASAPVYDPGAPCTIAVELATPDHADPYRHRAGVTLTGPRTVESTAPTWWDAWRAIYLRRPREACVDAVRRARPHDGRVAVARS